MPGSSSRRRRARASGSSSPRRASPSCSSAKTSCNGTPLTDIKGTEALYGGADHERQHPQGRDRNFDSALVYAVDSARVLNLAKVGKGRTLLDRGQYAPAGGRSGRRARRTTSTTPKRRWPCANQINLIWNNNNLKRRDGVGPRGHERARLRERGRPARADDRARTRHGRRDQRRHCSRGIPGRRQRSRW